MERWPAPPTLSLTALREHAEAIEVDYQRFAYSLETLEPGMSSAVAKGVLEVVGRASREALRERFAHRWVFEHRALVRVEPTFGPGDRHDQVT